MMRALRMAKLEKGLNITSSYYFRYPQTFTESIVSDICDLGHEVGYHYEELARANGNYTRAMTNFEKALICFKKTVPIRTVSAHGSILSKWDNKKLWSEVEMAKYGK